MLVPRIVIIAAGIAGLFATAPASAQFFFKSADLTGARVTGEEPGMTGPILPSATAPELSAALVWNLRAALNVAALQCGFEPTLMTLANYNAFLKDHDTELDQSMAVLDKYFFRMTKNKKAGQTELDKFLTRVYSGFSTVGGQRSFCQTAASIGHDAVFASRGQIYELAHSRMRELRASLAAWGEQQFRARTIGSVLTPARPLPPFGNPKCWKKERYQEKKCGPLQSWG
ncbi:hypothetical protein IAG41_21385 [Sphingomonas sp. JC676]|uniref:hypothetical protein n=1 Tax=Sphingomonas sp. JC676 TaxID=2768065 RepID=UPI001658064C|nr:hypothetical protein [Sphingomonas sp. JC676]MBC9034953.1 hypothetical protein [Sphingomonas sp. JC676]